jgi:mannitol-specific phosphotransferase system IIBC component
LGNTENSSGRSLSVTLAAITGSAVSFLLSILLVLYKFPDSDDLKELKDTVKELQMESSVKSDSIEDRLVEIEKQIAIITDRNYRKDKEGGEDRDTSKQKSKP